MKVTSVAEQIDRSGIQQEKEFGIIFDAKMVRILSDQLYQDKVGSIIRELSCNAYDSHVEAGKKDVPFVVHLPNRLEPFFYVQDYGVGLSPEQVRKIYTVYGSSTKTSSNEQIGQLGLGSKSPFSYVDAFDVIAVKNGKMSSYSMYKDERGMTCCAELGEPVATDEPNGVMVRFPVKSNDIYEFTRKAQEVFKWFPNKPTITGVAGLKIEEVQYFWETPHWGIIDTNKNSGYSTYNVHSIAIMGNVAYPLTPDTFKDVLTEGQRELINRANLVLKFDIGELEVTASREGLGYDARTIAAIKRKFDTLTQELQIMFEQEIQGSKTLWEAKHKFGELFSGDKGIFKKIFATQGLKWGKEVIKDNVITFKQSDVYGVREIVDSTGKIVGMDPTVIWDLHVMDSYYGSRKKKPVKSHSAEVSMAAAANVVVIFNDLKAGAFQRINHVRDSNKSYFVFGPSSKLTWDQLAVLLGSPEYILTSTLDKPPKAVPQPRPAKVLVWSPNAYGNSSGWLEKTVDMTIQGIYVDLNRWDVKIFGSEYGASGFSRILANLYDAKVLDKDTVIHAGRGVSKKDMTAQSNWTTLEDHVTKNFNALDLVKVSEQIKVLHQTNSSELSDIMSLLKVEWIDINDNSDFKKICNKMSKITDDAIKNQDYLRAVNALLGLIQTDQKDKLHDGFNAELRRLNQQLRKQYALVQPLMHTRYTGALTKESVSYISEYVKLADENLAYRNKYETQLTA